MSSDLLPLLRDALAGRYRVDRELAQGGMATVFLVHDERHDRTVALKMMKSGAAEGGAQRFLREIGVTARLSHPHILPLLDSGTLDDLPFYVMPFVDGETLRNRMVRESRLPIADAVHFTAEVADALAYAHAQGIVHRDIKPANILLSGRHAIVADFGVAKALATQATGDDVTQPGLAVGTVAYMSPEQAVGGHVDGRSDVFSLAVMLFEMLVGEKAFGGSTVQEQLARRFSGIVPSARARVAEIPDALDAVLLRALATEPDHRYATAGEFEAALLASVRDRGHAFETGAIHIARAPEEVPSIAVLPFENLTSSSDNDYLSDGITEEILTQLSRRRTMRVCARHSSFAFRGTGVDARTIGSRLGVRHLVTGSVRRAGDRLRVSAQLVDASNGFQAWSDRYDRELADVFEIQDDIASSITGSLNATLLGEVTAPAPARPPRLEVYEALLKGRHLWNRRTAEGTARAIGCFRQAIDLDAEYAPAWAGLAEAWVTQAVYGTVDPGDAMPRAREAAEAALVRDPSLAEARAALAQVEAVHGWRWSPAESMFRQAIALNPQLPAAHQGLAILTLTPRGRHVEALASINEALALDPLSPVLRVTLAGIHLYARAYQQASDAATRVLDLEPSFAPAHYFLAQALLELGEIDGAVQHAARAVDLSRESSETLAVLGLAAARAGDLSRARTIAESLGAAAERQYASPTHRALVALALGQDNEALAHLERAFTARAADLVWLGVRPAWDPLRASPTFAGLVSRLQLG